MSMSLTKAQNHAGSVRSNVARMGLIGKGALYVLLGLLAINVAAGNRASASKAGAIQTVVQAPFGKFLLIALTAAVIALVVWKFSQAASGDPVEGSDPSDRAKYAFKGVAYGGAALTSLSILIANWGGPAAAVPAGGGGDEGGQQQAAGVVMGLPGGRWIVMLVGLAAIGVGGYQIYKHTFNCGFMERFGSLEQGKRHTVETLGRAGYVGSGVVTIGVGFFLFIAGLTFDPNNVKGLSGLLAELAGQGWGQVLLWLIALGLFAYGLFAFAEARYRRAT
jgi:Domain of Unknown Function (DUF1206)